MFAPDAKLDELQLTHVMRQILITLLACLIFCCANSTNKLEVHGALRAMFHQGQTGTVATLDTLTPNPNLYAVGALTELSGEITIIGGETYLSYSQADGTARCEVSKQSDAGATLLVSTEVEKWVNIATPHAIAWKDFDLAIAKLASAASLDLEGRFPFMLEGEFENLQWHVIDGKRLTSGGTSHEDHLAASVQTKRDRVKAKLIGFYSPRDKTIFTHHDSTTHVHCVVDAPLATGHVDHVIIPAGTLVSFPYGWR